MSGDNFTLKSQFIKDNIYRSKNGLDDGSLTHIECKQGMALL